MEEMDTGEEGNEGIVGDDESIEFTRNNLASSNIDGQTSTSDIATEEFTSSRADVLRQQGNIKAATLRQQSGGNTQSASYSVIVKVLYEQNDYEVLLNKFNNLSNDEVIATLLKELYDELAIRYRASYNKRSSTYKVTTPDASAAIAAREYLNRKEVDFSRPGQEPVKIRLFAGTYGSLQGIHKVIDHPRTYSFTFSAPLGVVVASEQDTNEEPLQFTVENENDIIEFFNTRVAEKVLEAIFKEDPIPEKAGMTFLFEKNAQTATNKILASVTEECAEKIPEGDLHHKNNNNNNNNNNNGNSNCNCNCNANNYSIIMRPICQMFCNEVTVGNDFQTISLTENSNIFLNIYRLLQSKSM